MGSLLPLISANNMVNRVVSPWGWIPPWTFPNLPGRVLKFILTFAMSCLPLRAQSPKLGKVTLFWLQFLELPCRVGISGNYCKQPPQHNLSKLDVIIIKDLYPLPPCPEKVMHHFLLVLITTDDLCSFCFPGQSVHQLQGGLVGEIGALVLCLQGANRSH